MGLPLAGSAAAVLGATGHHGTAGGGCGSDGAAGAAAHDRVGRAGDGALQRHDGLRGNGAAVHQLELILRGGFGFRLWNDGRFYFGGDGLFDGLFNFGFDLRGDLGFGLSFDFWFWFGFSLWLDLRLGLRFSLGLGRCLGPRLRLCCRRSATMTA